MKLDLASDANSVPVRHRGGWLVDGTDKLRKKLTRVDAFDEPYELFLDMGDQDFLVPLNLHGGGWECEDAPVDFDFLGAPRTKEQARVMNEAASLSKVGASFVVEAPTGFGKTVVAAAVMSVVGQRTLVVVHKKDLMNTWVARLKQFLRVDGAAPEVSLWHADVKPASDADVVVAMVQSISKVGRYPDSYYAGFGLVVVDEVHRMAAPEFSKAMFQIGCPRRMGLSATPRRRDGRDSVIRAHIGPVKVSAHLPPMTPVVHRVKSGFRLPRKWVDNELRPAEPEMGRTTWVDKRLAEDARRNAKVCKLVARLHELGRNTVVFAATRRQLSLLSTGLKAMGVPHDFYVGGRSEEELLRAAAKPVVLATYKMGSEGTDCPWWDACVLASPVSNVKQAVGRVLRQYPDKPTPVVVDVVDPGRVWGAYARGRMAVYLDLRAQIK